MREQVGLDSLFSVKQFVMSLPAISLGDWFSVNGKGGTGVSACTLQMIHTTYVRTNVPTHNVPCKALSRDGMSKVTYNSHTYNRLVRHKFSNGNYNPILPPSHCAHSPCTHTYSSSVLTELLDEPEPPCAQCLAGW